MDKSQIASTICGALAVFNAIMVMLGKSTLDIPEDAIYNVVSGVALIASSVLIWWKNHNVTKEAQEGQKVIDALKEEKKRQKGSDK